MEILKETIGNKGFLRKGNAINMSKLLITGTLSLVFLVGCAGKNNAQVVKADNGSTLTVETIYAPVDMNNNHYSDVKLREVTPVSTGAGVGMSVLTAVLGGGISTGSFDKNSYKGTSVDALPEPTAHYFTPKAVVKIKSWLDKNGNGYAYTQPLFIAAAQWSLVYSDMSANNSNYDLTYRVLFYKRPEGGNILSAYVVSECAPKSATAPLSDWKANNYAKVTQETQKLMDACVLELDNQLPRLLKK
ncbi:hypothetical protein [Pantoea ananatis]|uniref:hypothetical protein n=1 Tax=Pantoea ananas TaxID=553 RepID=UPI001B30E8F7|nr:hypothetical protein [Pantoea ananatis]